MKLLVMGLSSVVLSVPVTDRATSVTRSIEVKCHIIAEGVRHYRGRTWHYQDKLQVTRTKAAQKTYQITSCKYAEWVAILWRSRSRHTVTKYHRHLQLLAKLRRARRVPRFSSSSYGVLTSDWACIHSHEGAWNANTGNGYYGGLQMDYPFMQSYGGEFLARWGTADNWPVWAQVVAANRAKNSGRGYSPWPNTAAMCGLL
jgi:hypothetical protein